MGKIGCTINGDLNVSKFNEPMPWIGLYVAAASALCAIAMAADAGYGIRYRKFWFPCKYFSLNATTLTLIAVAVKFSVDLNTSMPHRQDQLAKISSSAFICTVISNFMPSLGTMDNTELMMNLIALVILVITVIVNLCIQLGTGVVFLFWEEHVCIMVIMLVLLGLLVSTAISLPITKRFFDLKYRKKLEVVNKECDDEELRNTPIEKRLRASLRKYWTMAYTCCPQFVIGRSATCTASGAFCLLSALTLAEAMFRSFFMPWYFKFCNGESDYKWSTTLVLVTQTVAVVIGSIGPGSRWFTAINFRCAKKARRAREFEFRVEKYWIKLLLEWQEHPLNVRIWGRHSRKYAHNVKTGMLEFCIRMQRGIVLVSKFVRFISIFVVGMFLVIKEFIKCNNVIASTDSDDCDEEKLSRFVMHLEGEEVLVDLLAKSKSHITDHFIEMSKKHEPENLIQLLEKFNCSRGFEGVSEFDSDKVPSLGPEEPPNCWALPVVTLTSIAMALPNTDHNSIKHLLNSVHEGLMLIKEVENHLDENKDLRNTRKAAEIVWLGVDLYRKWLDVDLHKLSLEAKSEKEVLQKLSDSAKNKFTEFMDIDIFHMKGCSKEVWSTWPAKTLAANSMYRICQTMLMNCENNENLSAKVHAVVCSILRACLTNLHHVISKQCHRSKIEGRLESIRSAVLLFGRTEKILKIVDRQRVEYLSPGQLAHIDDWKLLCKKNKKGDLDSCGLLDGEKSSFSDLYISIDK